MLLKLKQMWYQRLKDEGFQDIECNDGSLKTYDRRTIAFDNRNAIMEFFLELDHYLAVTKLNDLDSQILNLYSQGMFITDIAYALGYSRQWITKIVKKHKVEMGYASIKKPITKKYILRKKK